MNMRQLKHCRHFIFEFSLISLCFVFLLGRSAYGELPLEPAVSAGNCVDGGGLQECSSDVSAKQGVRRSLSSIDNEGETFGNIDDLQVDEDFAGLDSDSGDLKDDGGIPFESAEGGESDSLNHVKEPSSKTQLSTAKPVPYNPPSTEGLLFAETFDGDVFKRWIVSKAEPFTGRWAKVLREKEAIVGDYGLQTQDAEQYHAIATTTSQALDNNAGKSIVVSYEVKLGKDHSCGGAYMKLFHTKNLPAKEDPDLGQFSNRIPYVIMFGPDVCGPTKKVHVIIRQENLVSHEWVEHHLTEAPVFPVDEETHLYTLALHPNNTYSVSIDTRVVSSGDMHTAFSPPFTPPQEIDDPTDIKPKTWVDDVTIPDPDAKKPDDWDEDAPAMIPDPNAKLPEGWLINESKTVPDVNAKKPETWNDDDDGEWEPPTIPNPACSSAPGCGPWQPPLIRNPAARGKWVAPMIPNPAYKGPWEPRKIPNPHYFVSKNPHAVAPINAIGFELWTIHKNIIFDNIVLSRSLPAVQDFIESTWRIRHNIESNRDTENKKDKLPDGKGKDLGPSAGASFLSKVQLLVSQYPLPVLGVISSVLMILIGTTLFGSRKPAQETPVCADTKPSETTSEGDEPKDHPDSKGDTDGEDTKQPQELRKEPSGSVNEGVARKRTAAKRD